MKFPSYPLALIGMLISPMLLQAATEDSPQAPEHSNEPLQISTPAADEAAATPDANKTGTAEQPPAEAAAADNESMAAVEPEPAAITAFDIEGALLIAGEKVEQALSLYKGKAPSKERLFSMRYTIIKLYRAHDYEGVAVAIPQSDHEGRVSIRVFEDDIDAYPQPEAKASPETPVTQPAEEKPEHRSSDTPQTFAINGIEDEQPSHIEHHMVDAPETVSINETATENPREPEAGESETADAIATAAQAVENIAIEPAPEPAGKINPQPEPASDPVPIGNGAATESIKAVSTRDNETGTTATTTVNEEKGTSVPSTTTAKTGIESQDKEASATNTPIKKAYDQVTEQKKSTSVAAAEPETPRISQREQAPVQEAEQSTKAANSAVIDARKARFDISGFAIYGNGLLKTAAIEKLLSKHIGSGKSYADLVEAKQAISELYRDKGHRMVAIALPTYLSDGTVPIRIFEADRR